MVKYNMCDEVIFSIVIPIYKVEKYLTQCIESVLAQTYKNYEIILVDDGSPDNCGNICDVYSKKYSFIHTIHKSNGGLADARNVGLKNVKGKYVIFLDSDDFWVDENFLHNIANDFLGYDLIIFNSFKYYSGSIKEKPRFILDDYFNNLKENEKIEYVLKNNIYKACAWDKIIKSEILLDNDLNFPIDMLSEDMLWSGILLKYIKKIYVYKDIVYAYRQRKSSISKTVSEKHLKDIVSQIYNGVKNCNNAYVLNYFAYEYSILLGYSCITRNIELINDIKNLTWLLNYNLSHKVKKVYFIFKILGFDISRKVLFNYIKHKK